MYNLIIVDDETEIRNGLRHKMDWTSLGFQIVGEASNGREAIELLEQGDIHLMITDIRMPIMDGMALLNEQKIRFPNVKTIILSGYDDFSYAKIAIQSGAKDYLLKPVIRKELIEMILIVCEELDREHHDLLIQDSLKWKLHQNNSLLQEHLMFELISEEGTEGTGLRERIHEMQLDEVLSEKGDIRIICVEMRLPHDRLGDGQGQIELMRSAYRMLCREMAQEYSSSVIVFHDWNHPNMMHFAVNYQDNHLGKAELQKFIVLLQSNIQKYLKVETIIAVGHAVRGLIYVKDAYISSLLVWSQNNLGVQSEIIWSVSLADLEVGFNLESEKKLTLLIESHDIEGINNSLRKLLTTDQYTLRALSQFVVKVYLLFDGIAKRNGINIPHIQQFFVLIPDVVRRFNSVEQVLENLGGIASELIHLLKTTRATGGANIVESIRQYIDRNYANEIGLSMLADRFYINPTYLSELFKKHVGQTFSEYVIKVRIVKTEKLLHDPSLRLSDIAELVGFSNASYLSSVFKKYYGKSPNDYRSTLSSLTT